MFGSSNQADLSFSPDTALDVHMTLGNLCLTIPSELSFPLKNGECGELLSELLRGCSEIICVEQCLTHKKALRNW